MNEHVLIGTHNIQAGDAALQYALTRPIAKQVGLCLVYGRPGLGKTQWSRRRAVENDYIWLSASATDTLKSFTLRIAEAIAERYNVSSRRFCAGSTSSLFQKVVDQLNYVTKETHLPVIMVDETDNLFLGRSRREREEKIGLLRDIADQTAATIVLIGMHELREKLQALNEHYYRRICYFCEFTKLTEKDVELMVSGISSVGVDAGVMGIVKQASRGDARNVIKLIRSIEDIAKANSLSYVTTIDYKRLEGSK